MFRYSCSILLLILMGTMSDLTANCVSGNCVNGKGTYLFKDGSKYVGTFLKSEPHGSGTYYSKDGSVYQGTFHHGKKQGNGQLTFKTGDQYIGEFYNNRMEGEGKMSYQNGDSYLGTWVNGRSSGQGIYTFADGDNYIGSFLDGEFNGDGKLSRTDGSYYEGEWARNKKHGQGVTYSKGKKMSQKYDMNNLISEYPYKDETTVENKPSTEIIPNASSTNKPRKNCTEQYCNNEKGYFKYGDGSVYSGDFVNGVGQGMGICLYANGDKYVGGWNNHAPDGKGTMYFKSGNTYPAVWDNGVPVEKLKSVALPEMTKTTVPTKQVETVTQQNNDGDIKIYSLVVGVATYNTMQSLKYTDDDAYQLFAFLKSPEGGAIPDDHIKILIDDAATSKSIMQELRNVAARADGNDVILLYMSGHGLDGAFVPSDFDGYQGQIAYGDILDILNGSAAKHKLFITDACHSGSMIAAARTPLNVALENFYSAYNTINGGTAIMMSSKKEEVSLEYGGLRQGIFSHFLIKGLKGEADKNKDKLITVTELYDYVSTQVRSYTANAQNPAIMGDFDKEMPIGLVR